MNVPLIFSFWFMVDAYVIHVIDETLLGGSFVEKVREHWWPKYSWKKFFWFNTGYFVIMIASVVAYDLRGGSWQILPLAWAIERLCNGFWHVWWTIRFREIFTWTGEQHPHLDGLLLHRPLRSGRGNHRATDSVGAQSSLDCCTPLFSLSTFLW